MASPSPATPPADGRDLLTSLPEEMVSQILERLPVKDAVRTSALATPWRRRWASCPGLRFAFSGGDRPAAVDAVLAAYACIFCELFLVVPIGWAARWVGAITAKGVKSLMLSFVINSRFKSVLPPQLFSCTTITKLELLGCYMPPLPAFFQGFPKLVDLRLEEITFSKHGRKTVEMLIATSPSLTVLRIIDPVIQRDGDSAPYEDWVIQAPKLTSIEISSREDYGWQVEDLPSLEQAEVLLQGHQLLRVLSAMTRVTDLFVDIMHETYEDEVEVDMTFLDVKKTGLLSQLKFCKFDGVMRHSSEMQFLEFLISKAKLLQKVEVSLHEESLTDTEVLSTEISNFEKASSCAEIIVNSFLGYHSEMSSDEDEPEN
ncbi:hypothetical protein EJB05_57299, partial [Eragrostis curvula]